MARRTYTTVGVDLAEYADTFADHFQNLGYRCSVEPFELDYPYRPTFVFKRTPITVIFEVYIRVAEERLDHWSKYCSSCSRDTRVAIGMPPDASVSAKESMALSRLGVGLYRLDSGTVREIIAPKDLALHIELPDLKTIPPRLRSVLGPVYEQFGRSMWREGFEDACQAVEQEVRRYLKKSVKTGRISFTKPGGALKLWSNAQIDKMTLGQLGDALKSIAVPNHRDLLITQGVIRLKKDRIGVAHYKGAKSTETRLRNNVGRHMYTVIATLRELLQKP